jgi:hypothetical protein
MKQLGLRPIDLGNDPSIRAIAQSSLTMVKHVNELRNDVGTGHGRARMLEITDAAERAAIDAAVLWCKWVLRVLDPLLAGSAGVFIEAVSSAISRVSLIEAMHVVDLPRQPPEAQHRIGVVVGQRAGGGFGNAWVVRVDPALNGGLDDWPAAYRLGLVEGFVLNWAGQIDLNEHSAQALIDIVAPVPVEQARAALEELAEKPRMATWAPHWRSQPVESEAVVSVISHGASGEGSAHAASLSTLVQALRQKLGGGGE